MKKTLWFERHFNFGIAPGLLPFFLERLRGTIVRLEEKVKGIPETVLSEKYEGKWSVKENIGHLADVDAIANKRIGEMIAGVSPMSPAVIQPSEDYNAMPIGDVLKRFTTSRLKNLERYATLQDSDLACSSQHPRLKVTMTPVDLAYLDAEHDDHHAVRMSEIIEALMP